MKQFLKVILLTISIFSLLGTIFLVVFYINKNAKSILKLLNKVQNATQDLKLTEKEVKNITKEAIKVKKSIVKSVEKDVENLLKSDLSKRQIEVLNFIKLHSDSKMSTISKVFNNVTPRTLRRDLSKLEQMGIVRQEGKTKDAVYKLV
jgi:DNA-binding transcriptional ArsR family regulator